MDKFLTILNNYQLIRWIKETIFTFISIHFECVSYVHLHISLYSYLCISIRGSSNSNATKRELIWFQFVDSSSLHHHHHQHQMLARLVCIQIRSAAKSLGAIWAVMMFRRVLVLTATLLQHTTPIIHLILLNRIVIEFIERENKT